MRPDALTLTIIGCGDAFGSGGRSHACFRLAIGGRGLFLDFGASALNALKKQGLSSADIDTVIVSHLHGDHFGGLPFLLLDCQFVARRTRKLLLAGPPGLRARLEMALEAFFPGSSAMHWTFPWEVQEIAPGLTVNIEGFRVTPFEMLHPSGAPPLGLRLEGHGRILAYSGDTGWTDALLPLADGADLLIIECYSGEAAIANHIDWPTLHARLDALKARRILVTHLGESALAISAQMRAAGCHVAFDGCVLDL